MLNFFGGFVLVCVGFVFVMSGWFVSLLFCCIVVVCGSWNVMLRKKGWSFWNEKGLYLWVFFVYYSCQWLLCSIFLGMYLFSLNLLIVVWCILFGLLVRCRVCCMVYQQVSGKLLEILVLLCIWIVWLIIFNVMLGVIILIWVILFWVILLFMVFIMQVVCRVSRCVMLIFICELVMWLMLLFRCVSGLLNVVWLIVCLYISLRVCLVMLMECMQWWMWFGLRCFWVILKLWFLLRMMFLQGICMFLNSILVWLCGVLLQLNIGSGWRIFILGVLIGIRIIECCWWCGVFGLVRFMKIRILQCGLQVLEVYYLCLLIIQLLFWCLVCVFILVVLDEVMFGLVMVKVEWILLFSSGFSQVCFCFLLLQCISIFMLLVFGVVQLKGFGLISEWFMIFVSGVYLWLVSLVLYLDLGRNRFYSFLVLVLVFSFFMIVVGCQWLFLVIWCLNMVLVGQICVFMNVLMCLCSFWILGEQVKFMGDIF